MRPDPAGTFPVIDGLPTKRIEGCRALGLLVPSDRPVRPGHRRVGVGEAGLGGYPSVFVKALSHGTQPSVVTTDRAPAYPRVLDELVPAACHLTEQYGNNLVETDHGRLKARLRPMRGLKQLRSTRVISAGHAFIQNLRRGHYGLGSDADPTTRRLTTAFTELALAI